ncbi:MAG: hypothetical protein GC160_16970 [Acidobacteria bacterium]|nr:hypothetical protein [Acidobacteriota bacterium]
MQHDTLVPVFTAGDLSANAEAEVLKALLESAGIPAIIRHTPPTFQRPGGVSLLVLSGDQSDAEELIRDAREEAIEAD